jgi:carboxyl-terminal processing protease
MWGGACLLAALIGFGAGLYTDQAFPDWVPPIARHSVGRVDTTSLEQAIRIIEADYIDSKLDPAKLSQGSVQGMIAALNDPYSAYFDPAAYKRLQESYAGRYTGIGVYLKFGTSYPEITGTIPGSPAATAGLQVGDQIVKVDGKDMAGVTSDQATAAIQGPDGTSLTMTIRRGTRDFDVTLKRAEIQVPSVRSILLATNILYVRIYNFGSTTSNEFASALKTGLSGAKGVVLDLREDPGGFITAADDVISEFVASGETFELRDRGGNVEKHMVGSEHLAPSIPLVVLVDASSASAAEIVAGSLQAHGRAQLVGTVTFGKGSVQQDFPLADGSDIHITIKRWYLPNGKTIDKKGLTPDVPVTLANASDEFDVLKPAGGYAKDSQLNAALNLVGAG